MDAYLKNLKNVLTTEFDSNVIPIALVKDAKQPLYSHKDKSNDDMWKAWDNKGFAEVVSENADLGLLIRNRALVVIDFDNKSTPEIFEENIPEFVSTVKQSTKKGYHFFFKGTELTKNMKLSNQVRPFGEEMDIDIITTWDNDTGGIITVYPSANKEWINNIIDTPIQPVPSKFIEFYQDKLPKKQETKKDKKQDNDGETSSCDFETLKKIVMGLSTERAVKFDDWHKVVWAIYNVCNDNNVSESKITRLIHNFSEQGGDKYDEDKVDEFINKNTNHCERGYKLGTLIAFLKEDNTDLYNDMFNKVLMYEEQKKIFELTHFKVVYPPCYCTIKDDGNITVQCRAKFKESHEHVQVRVMRKNKPEEAGFVDKWFKDPKIRMYDYIDFLPPPMVCPPKTFNMWRGFAIERTQVESSGNVQPVLDHISVLVNHDNKAMDYVIKWFAQIVQRPGALTGIALVFKSEQGSGKNIFLDFIDKIMGNDLFYETANPVQDLWSRFALGRKNKLLINIDETKGKDTYAYSDILKNMITSSKFNFEDKGVSPITLSNLNRIVFTTNNQSPIKVEEGDRRYCIFQSSDEKKGNKKYFDALLAYINDKANQKAFFEYLKTVDVSSVDWINDRPITALYQEIQEANAPIHVKFFKFIVENNDEQAELKYSGFGLFEHFNEFLEKGRYTGYAMNNTAWGRLMKPMIRNKGDDNSKAFINKGMSNGRTYYKVVVGDIRKWLVDNKFMAGCIIEDDAE